MALVQTAQSSWCWSQLSGFYPGFVLLYPSLSSIVGSQMFLVHPHGFCFQLRVFWFTTVYLVQHRSPLFGPITVTVFHCLNVCCSLFGPIAVTLLSQCLLFTLCYHRSYFNVSMSVVHSLVPSLSYIMYVAHSLVLSQLLPCLNVCCSLFGLNTVTSLSYILLCTSMLFTLWSYHSYFTVSMSVVHSLFWSYSVLEPNGITQYFV